MEQRDKGEKGDLCLSKGVALVESEDEWPPRLWVEEQSDEIDPETKEHSA